MAAYWFTGTVAKFDVKLNFDERQLHHWKLLQAFQQRLEPVLASRDQTPTELNARRKLQAGGYLSMMLFALLNPVIKSTRALCAASGFQRMQAEVCGEPVSLGSFSEMQAVCEPNLLAGLLRELSAQAQPVFGDERVRAKFGI